LRSEGGKVVKDILRWGPPTESNTKREKEKKERTSL